MTYLIDNMKSVERITQVFISPIIQSWDFISNNKFMVIIGTEDQLFTEISVDEVVDLENLELYLVEGGDHFLEVGDYKKSIDEIKETTERIQKYIRE